MRKFLEDEQYVISFLETSIFPILRNYTHPYYVNKLKELGIMQSMSRKGNCLDNAPIESFFGHLKDEVDLKSCQSFDEVKSLVENYIYYYNNERYQWNLNKMTPAQCRCHLLNSL